MTLKYVDQSPRVAKQDAKNAVRDPLDALIELITNSMDSYNRMKARNEKIPKDYENKIEVYIYRKTKKEKRAIIAVKDWAEGISPNKMKEYISGYGARTSGKETYQNIRGYFGRGLKDSVGGLDGIGYLYSVKKGIISYGMIDGTDKNGIKYDDNIKQFDANKTNLKRYHLDDDGKTIAMVEFPTNNMILPLFDTFAEKLSLCVELRPLMEKGNLELIQIERGKAIKRRKLKYNQPKGRHLLYENDIRITGELATFNIEIKKADQPLNQAEEQRFRVGGLLIMSGTSVHEATLLKFDKDPNASKFFGKVTCNYIDRLMREDEHVVTPDRQGLNWSHPFLTKLKKDIEKKLQPFVDLEKKERDKSKSGINQDALKRNEMLGKKLGKLYKELMGSESEFINLAGEDTVETKRIQKPSLGFAFIPPFYCLELKKIQNIRIVVESPKIIPSYQDITFDSTNENIVLDKKKMKISEGEYIEEEGVYIIKNGMIGKKPDERGKIIAKTYDKRDEERIIEAYVHVTKSEDYPENGFAFIPNNYRLRIEKPTKIILKIDSDLVKKQKMNINISSDNKYIVIEKPKLSINIGRGVVEERITVRGTRVGEKGIITAIDMDNSNTKAEAEIWVISPAKKTSTEGFEIEHDYTDMPMQRSLCTGNIIYIFVKEPTVSKYFGKNGEYVSSLSFEVLCADLIMEAFCNKVVEDMIQEDKIVYPGGNKETAIRRKLNELRRRCGPEIHKTYVNKSLLMEERKDLEALNERREQKKGKTKDPCQRLLQ